MQTLISRVQVRESSMGRNSWPISFIPISFSGKVREKHFEESNSPMQLPRVLPWQVFPEISVSINSQTISSSPSREQRPKSCSNCGVSFTCGPTVGKPNCWCEEFPRVSLAADAGQDCLCPECLRRAIENLPQNQSAMRNASSSVKPIADSPPVLVEG